MHQSLLSLLLLTATSVLLVWEVTPLLSMAIQLLRVLPSRLIALLDALPDRLVLCRLVVGTSSRLVALVGNLHASLVPPSGLVVPVGQLGCVLG